jgi:hypothetical protein
MLARGEVKSFRELARLANVTPARITQIMSLLNLAPEVQERVLLDATDLDETRLLRLVRSTGRGNQQRELRCGLAGACCVRTFDGSRQCAPRQPRSSRRRQDPR